MNRPDAAALGCLIGALLLLTALAIPALSAGSSVVWARQFGTPGYDAGMRIVVDASGVYVVGSTEGRLPNQTSAGSADAFVRRYDFDGREVWTRQFGSSLGDGASGVATNDSSIYVVGTTEGIIPGGVGLGDEDGFLRKYDVNGNLAWTRQFGTNSTDRAAAVAADASGIYVAGTTRGEFLGETKVGEVDSFVRKYHANGTEDWTRQFGTSGSDLASDVAVFSSSVFIAGWDEADAFVRKYHANGTEDWTRRFGLESAFGVAAGPSGIFVAGVSFNGMGMWNASLRKYDADGIENWTRQFGTGTVAAASSVLATSSAVYVAGYVDSAIPGRIHFGRMDGFIRKYDLGGSVIWTRQFGTPEDDGVSGLYADDATVYVAGATWGDLAGPTAGAPDVFVMKQDPNDVDPPDLLVPDSLTVEAASPLGATVTYGVSALDDGTESIDVACAPPSGSTFPLGETTVACTATDAAGNTATASFSVLVQDTTPPNTTLTDATDGRGRDVEDGTTTSSSSLTIWLGGSDLVGVAGFECSLDEGPYVPCDFWTTFSGLQNGNHTLRARAFDDAGNADGTPITLSWRVESPPPGPPLSAYLAVGLVVFALVLTVFALALAIRRRRASVAGKAPEEGETPPAVG